MPQKDKHQDARISKKHLSNSRIPRKTRWTLEEVREMPTDKILGALHTLGIPMSMEVFREQVREFCSAEDLSEHWFETYSVAATGWDEDFPWFAAWVLWERLDGDTIPYESILEFVEEGLCSWTDGPDNYGRREHEDMSFGQDDLDEDDFDLTVLESEEGSDEDAEAASEDEQLFRVFGVPRSSATSAVCWMHLRAWEYIKALFSGKAASVEEAMDICKCASALGDWCMSVVDNLGFGSDSSPSLARERLRFAREFCEVFPASGEKFIREMRSAEAEALFSLGRIEEGDEVFRTIIQQWPDWTWGYICWGDAYIRKGGGHPDRRARAREIFSAALRYADESDAQVIMERLECLGNQQ